MADAKAFYQTANETVKQFIYWIDQINTLQDRMVSDPALAASAAEAANAAGRTDLVEADFTNLSDAIVQIMFTWNSGDPTQKSFFYKML